MFENSSGLFSWFFFWPGWNPVGIDGVAVGLGIEPRSKDQAYRHGIRDVVSTRTKVFLRFLLKQICDIRVIRVR